MAKCGTPEAYTPWVNPKRDPHFQAAWRENRVLTIQQNAAGKDFGVVGFQREQNVSYLLFPKPLTEFEGRKVVGIAYDVVHTPPRGPVVKPSVAKKKVRTRPSPGTRSFHVTVCVTAKVESIETVHATSSEAAKKQALKAAASRDLDWKSGEITREVVGIKSV
ncbi:MAG TPA: hypothetical protein VJ063_03780 [Verrucomicrobiae bacterium]|nr:hypothetical protein [Verrucomicrobiae bacterium]